MRLQTSTPTPVIGEGELSYNPTNEWIFPSLLCTDPLRGKPFARWYLYYSPHDPPGGICLATANHLQGPWKEYEQNPLIAKDWMPHFSVNHVASPHALWMPDYGRVFLWFHGPNGVTRCVSSADGINFRYEGVAISTGELDFLTETSYARVFPYELPGTSYAYIMLFMGNHRGTRSIYYALSPDGKNWVPEKSPLVTPAAEYGENTSGPSFEKVGERIYVFHHIDRFTEDRKLASVDGEIYATPISPDLRSTGKTERIYVPSQGHPDNKRAGDCHFVRDGDECFMFYVGGRRLKGRIYVRKITVMTLDSANTDPP